MKNLQGQLVLLAVAAVMGLFLWGWQSLATAPVSGAATPFLKDQAFETLSRLLAEQVPHPTGSPANHLVRDRIVETLKAYGYEPQVQTAFQCALPDRSPGCTKVDNILAVRKGSGSGKAILATAHYDSVPAGPGVADDGVGVAVMLELSRMLKSVPPSRNDIIFLLTDGEETGLRGALAFAEQNALMTSVALVVNVESRGDTGPSIMFETGPGNAMLIELFASVAPSPVSNSLAYEIYRLLPNDTDFSIYKRYGLNGFNFAMIGSASRYHSPRDDLAHLDRNTLQHHGDHAFALVKALMDAKLEELETDSDASYFDVFGVRMVVWPASANLPLALLALAGLVALVIADRKEFGWKSAGLAICAIVATGLLLLGLGWALSWPLGIWPGVHPLDHPLPWPARLALLSALVLAASLIAALFARQVSSKQFVLTNWLLLSVLAVACAATLPGAAYALIWPSLAVAIAGWGGRLSGRDASMTMAASAGFLLAAFFWISHFIALEAVLGFNLSQFKLLALLPLALAMIPLFVWGQPTGRSQAVNVAIAALALAATAATATQSHGFSADHPRPLNFIYYDDKATGQPKWLVAEVPSDEAFLRATGFAGEDTPFRMAGLVEVRGRFKPAVDASLPAPEFKVATVTDAGGRRVISGELLAARSGFVMALGVEPGSGILSIRAEGQLVVGAERLAGKDPIVARLFGLADQPLKVEIEFDPSRPSKLVLLERSQLPDTADARTLLAARPANAAPVHSGDGSLVFQQIDLATLKPALAADPQAP
ncbi:MAG: M28 family peptidase [Micropepsaceae bacterium]